MHFSMRGIIAVISRSISIISNFTLFAKLIKSFEFVATLARNGIIQDFSHRAYVKKLGWVEWVSH